MKRQAPATATGAVMVSIWANTIVADGNAQRIAILNGNPHG
jgi:hypothetical protein